MRDPKTSRTAAGPRRVGCRAVWTHSAVQRAARRHVGPRGAAHAAERARPRLREARAAAAQRGVAAAEHDDLDARPRNCEGIRRDDSVALPSAAITAAAPACKGRQTQHRHICCAQGRGICHSWPCAHFRVLAVVTLGLGNEPCILRAPALIASMQMGARRTAVAALDLGQAGAARRRAPVRAAQREAPEVAPAAIQRAQQGGAVLCVTSGDWLPATVTEGRSIGSTVVRRQQQPCGLPPPDVLADLRIRRRLFCACVVSSTA